jgi:hypothetical protein
MSRRKLDTIINSARKFQEGYFDPEKGSNQEFERKIQALSNALAKTTDPEDKVLYAEQIQKIVKEYRKKNSAPNPRTPPRSSNATPTPKRNGRTYKPSHRFGGKRRTQRITKKPKKNI